MSSDLKKPVFIMGNPRSGTTLLYRIIQQHSVFKPQNIPSGEVQLVESNIFCEYPQFENITAKKFLLNNERIYEKFLQRTYWQRAIRRNVSPPRFALHRYFPPAGRSLIYRISGGKKLANEFFTAAKVARGFGRLAEKTPGHIRYLPEIFSVFPDAQCIFLIRHPVDVYSSYRRRNMLEQTSWLQIPPKRFAKDYRHAVSLAINQVHQDPRSMIIVKFEDLTHHPKVSATSLCAFLGISFENSMIQNTPRVFDRLADPLLSKVIVPSEQTKRWEDFLSQEEAAYIETQLDDIMRKFSYSPYSSVRKITSNTNPEISVILPCRNEEAALRKCLQSIKNVFDRYNLAGEIIVSDSSTDNSPAIAKEEGARLIKHDQIGYGAAYLAAFPHVRSRYIFCADADGSYDFNEIPRFLNELRGGKEFVIGNRFSAKIQPGAMPYLNRFIGNPLLTSLTKMLFQAPVSDVHSGMRALTKNLWQKLQLTTTGMEFASEMVIKVVRHTDAIAELPIEYHPRQGVSKLRPFTDGWRHVRLLIMYSPLWSLVLPGALISLLGLSVIGVDYTNITNLIIGTMIAITGYQLFIFGLFSKIYAIIHMGERSDAVNHLFRFLTLKRVGLLAACFVGLSVVGILLSPDRLYALTTALALLIISVQTFTAAFMFSMISIRR